MYLQTHSLVTLYLYILLPFIFLSAVHLSFLSHLLISKYLLPSSWQEFDWFLLSSPLQTVAAHEVVCALVGSVSVSASECFFPVCVVVWYIFTTIHRSITTQINKLFLFLCGDVLYGFRDNNSHSSPCQRLQVPRLSSPSDTCNNYCL